jgi:cytochrome c biogenesis protein CcdA
MFSAELIYTLVSLAAVDAINPCEFAVMTMVLATILLKNPEKRKKVLQAGLMFTLAIFVGYLFYGFVIVQFFKHAIPATSSYALYIFRGFGAFAIILGLLNVKDYLWYNPGGIATEMPLSLRPRAKLLISKITSPTGAFFIGLFVTIFLIPCTMGPYVIFSGVISDLDIWHGLFLLLIYNIIFIIPMLLLTMIIYFGVSSVEKFGEWKEKNIKKLHLAEGVLLILLGIVMLTGLI